MSSREARKPWYKSGNEQAPEGREATIRTNSIGLERHNQPTPVNFEERESLRKASPSRNLIYHTNVGEESHSTANTPPASPNGGPKMRATRSAPTLHLVTIVTLTLFLSVTARAQSPTEQILYEFGMQADSGGQPYAPLIFDNAGNLYGTTSAGGLSLNGTAFKLSPNGDGTWTRTTLYDFGSIPGDGADPVAGLAFDSAGNLYGTTRVGGANGNGTVFKLTPNPSGYWTETQLYSFQSGTDGSEPFAGVVLDADGHVYGTTEIGGQGYGTVFELAPLANGTWKEHLIHTFTGGSDGGQPFGGVVIDASGNLYGNAGSGGANSCGLVFEFSKSAGAWHEQVVHMFHGTDGCSVYSSLYLAPLGIIYGTDIFNTFALTPLSGGRRFSVVYTWGPGEDNPNGSLVMDSHGNLFGTTYAGGSANLGTVFEVSPEAHGKGKYQILHNFSYNIVGPVDGWTPNAGLTVDPSGNVYGTTIYGGYTTSTGVVFEVTP